ncbi:MAG: PilC/PilY family type IV pilus protein [Pseudomonadota bacterium]
MSIGSVVFKRCYAIAAGTIFVLASLPALAANPLARDDDYSINEDSGLNVLCILNNDTDGLGAIDLPVNLPNGNIATVANIALLSAGPVANNSGASGDCPTPSLVPGASNAIAVTPKPDLNSGPGGLTKVEFYYGARSATGGANYSGACSIDNVEVDSCGYVTVTILPVNDAPSFVKGPDQVVAESAGAQLVPAWATGMSKGPANEALQTLSFLVSTNNNYAFDSLPAVDATTGNLTYKLKDGYNDSSPILVTVTLKDNGGTDRGGVDSFADTFKISVPLGANDAPVVTVPGAQSIDEDVATLIASVSADDVDSNSGNITARAQVSKGTLNVALAGAATFSMGANDSADFTLSGTLADINTTLASLTYTSNLNYNGPDVLTVTVNDGGNTGFGPAGIDAETVNITVDPVNDAPTGSGAPTDVVVTEDAESNFDLSAFSVADVENDPLTLTITVSAGTFTSLADGAGIGSGVTESGAGTSTVTLVGASGDINTYLATASNVTYTSVLNANGADAAIYTINANDGSVNPLVGSGTVDITAVDDAPTGSGAPADIVVTEDVESDFDLSAFSVAEVDGETVTLTIDVTGGSFTTLADGAGVGAGVTESGAGTGTVTLVGSAADIKSYLGTSSNITYTTALNAAGADVATYTIRANDGTTNPVVGSGTVDSTAVNDAPTGSGAPADVVVTEDAESNFDLSAFSVADVDNDPLTLTIAVTAGTFTSLADGAGIGAGVTESGAGTSTVTLVGAAGDINTYLATASNITYTSVLNANGADSATYSINANDGAVNPLVGSGTVDITAVDDVPTGSGAPADVVVTEDVESDFDLSAFSVAEVDGETVTLTIDVTGGSFTTLADGAGVGAGVTESGAGTGTVTLVGSAADITSYLGTSSNITYTTALNAAGADIATYTINANDGTTNPVVGSGTVDSTAVNDAPTGSGAPADVVVTEDAESNFDLSAFSVADVDNDPLTLTIAVTAGTFTSLADGAGIGAGVTESGAGTSTVTLVGAAGDINTYLATASNITYTTVLDASGPDVATYSMTASDGALNPVVGSGTIDSTPVNDAPSGSGAPADVVVTEDAESDFDLTAFSVADVDGDTLTVTISVSAGTFTTLADGAGIGAGVVESGAGTATVTLIGAAADITSYMGTAANITYTTVLNALGPDVATYTINANDGSVNPQVGSGTVDSVPVNDAPTGSGAPADVVVIEDVESNFDLSGFSVADVDGDAITLTVAVSAGTFTSLADGAGIGAGVTESGAGTASITLSGSLADLNSYLSTASNITYTTTTNTNGSDIATYTINANDGIVNPQIGNGTVDATAVNDVPTFTVGADQGPLLEDAVAQTVPGFIADGSPGPLDEAGQVLSYTVTNDLNSLFSVQPAIDAAGQLTYTPAANASGAATVSVYLSDDGGTTNGGVDQSGVQTFTITITAVADAPSLAVNNAITTNEDVAAGLGIVTALVDTDASETLSVTISGLPSGAEISDGVNSSSSTSPIDVSAWTLSAITVVGAPNSDADFAITVTATATEGANSDTADTAQVINVTVDPVSDTPGLVVADVTADEDTVIPISISGSLVDTDTSEVLTYELSNVSGTLSAGTDNGGGSWSLSASDVSGLTLTPITHSDADFVIVVDAIATDGVAAPAVNSDTITVTIDAVSDAPGLTVTGAVSADEDVALPLTIAGSLVDTDGSEVLTYELTNVSGMLNAGTDNGGGSWTLAAGDVAGLVLTPIAHSDVDFTITVTAVATDGVATAATTADTIAVTLNAVSDTPGLVVADVTANEDTVIPLTVNGTLVDTDGSEVLTYELTNVVGTLSAGTNNGGGSWSLTAAQAAGLTLTPELHSDADFVITVDVFATDGLAAAATVQDTISVTVDAVSDVPNLSVSDASGDEDTVIALTITSSLVDTDGSEVLTLELTGVNGTLSAGTDNGGGSWSLTPAQLAGLSVTPPANDSSSFIISVTAIATDGLAAPASDTQALNVTINEINDPPVVNDQAFAIDENATNGSVVGTLVATNTEVTETLTYQLTGTAFAIDGTGQITVADVSQLDRESISVFNLTATVTDNGSPNLDDTASVDITINPLNDNAPVAVEDNVTVDELATIAFNVLTNDSDADLPAQTLSVSEVDGNPANVGAAYAVISGGKTVGTLTLNSDGSASFVATSDITVEEFSATVSYQVSDGAGLFNTANINITITPQNDNDPALTAAGSTLAADGISHNEDQYTAASRRTIVLSQMFIDLDIDADGLLDGSTGDDNDSLVFTVNNNTDPALISTNITGNDLELWSPAHEHGAATLTIRAQDTALPGPNAFVDLVFTVTVNSVNDAPLAGSFGDRNVDEDSGDIVLDLAGTFTDADLTDSDPSDDQLTFTVTLVDRPNTFVPTGVIDESNLAGAVVLNGVPAAGQRTITYTTTNASVSLQLEADAHGEVDVTVRGTDLGRPPEAPAAAIPLFDEDSFRITVNAIGDDTPTAADDHYSDFPELIIDEDSDPIIFNPTLNDYQGDPPLKVILAGQEFVDDSGSIHRYRSSTRQADPLDTGDLQTIANGEVSCADAGCQDNETADTTVDGSGLGNTQIIYKPAENFHGEDSFTYCIQDDQPGAEAPFTPPADVRCATVTVLVQPVNDVPTPQEPVTFVMEQAGDLVCDPLLCGPDNVQEGLRAKVRDIDNTHMDGQGCDPLDPACTPVPGSEPDTIYFRFNSALTAHGQLLPPFETDGSFIYRPSASFAGEDSFLYDVCDTSDFSDADRCLYDQTAYIVIEPLEGAPPGSVEDVVEFDFQLSQIPLELVVGPEPNVLIVNDDSGSMDWDILTDQSDGIYYFDTGNYVRYVMQATAGNNDVAASEEASPNQGVWRLRNADFNTVYYNPDIRYTPWDGLDTSDNEFPDSPPTAARHNPLTATPTTNLRLPKTYTGVGVSNSPQVCQDICLIPNWFGSGCLVEIEVCTGGSNFGDLTVNNYYIPRYYRWTDRDGDLEVDATPSPILDPANSEGELVEIKPASEGGSDTYPRHEDRTDCVAIDGVCTFDEELQNFANWFTYSRNREFTAKSALGKVVASAENIRIGYAKLNSTSNVETIKSMNSSERTGEKADLLDSIYQTNSSGGTPLRRSLRDAGRHFECRSGDIFDSSSNSSPGDSKCPVLPAPEGNCQQNFTLLMSDGAWNGGNPSVGDADDDNNTNFDGGMFAGSYDNTLADVAMHYYERDLHPSLDNEVPTTARDIEGAAVNAFENNDNRLMHQHMTTFTVGFGVDGIVTDDDVPTDYTQSFDWGNPTTTARKIDDARHAAVNGRGAYLSAGNASDLAEALVSAFEEFSAGSGAASAVSFNSQEIQEETLIFRAFYNTKINTGDLVAIPFTDAGLGAEPVWRAAEQMDDISWDNREILTWDGIGSTGIPFRPGSLNAEQRAVFTDSADPVQQNIEITQRVNYLRGDSTNERPVGNFRERPVVEGRLGDIVHSSPIFVGPPSRLGRTSPPYPQADLYTTFAASNGSRQDVLYVSANDGMLHGFNADTGDEIFAYVPDNLMTDDFSRNITNLLDFNYQHKYFVDLTPAVNDIYIDVDGVGGKEWATVLIGGHGAGAKAYFALDVTDPGQLTESNAGNVVLWEFTEKDDTYPTDAAGNPLTNADGSQRQDLRTPAQPVKDLGYTFSVPTMAMSNLVDNGEQRWVAIFGNGYNSTSGIAKLFILFPEGGIDGEWCHPDRQYDVTLSPGAHPCDGKPQDFIKIDTTFGVQDGLPNGLGIPRLIDVDGNGTVDYVYAGDYFGNLFRFDLTSDNFNDWSVQKIFEAAYDDGGLDIPQPITTQPIVVEHPSQSDGFIVIFATGSYMTVPDGTDTSIQSIYGIWDRLSPELITRDDLVQQRYTNFDDPDLGRVRSLSANAVDYSAGIKGWFNDLDSVGPGETQGLAAPEFPGERAIRRILLRGGLVFVNSVIPQTENSCLRSAGGALLSFCPGTGGSDCISQSVFDVNNDGSFDELIDDNDFVTGVVIEDGKPPTDSGFLEDKLITQVGEDLLIVDTDTRRGNNTGRISWKQVRAIP